MIRNQRGMTLLEIMIVVAIIGGLMAVMAPRIFNQMDKSNYSQTKLIMKNLVDKLEEYRLGCNEYPEELRYLMEEPASCNGTGWGPEPYINPKKGIPKDAFGGEFVYEADGGEFTITSYGKDRREGGKGFDKDISSDDF